LKPQATFWQGRIEINDATYFHNLCLGPALPIGLVQTDTISPVAGSIIVGAQISGTIHTI
jgi:hypothetical protein